MPSAREFRRIALAMSDAVESAHMGHPDFRVNGRIFATLHPDHRSGMVKFTPDQQQSFVRENPGAFTPENGAWGRQGCTRVPLDSVDEDKLGEALTLAWQNIVQHHGRELLNPMTRRVNPINDPGF
jgi:YjbR